MSYVSIYSALTQLKSWSETFTSQHYWKVDHNILLEILKKKKKKRMEESAAGWFRSSVPDRVYLMMELYVSLLGAGAFIQWSTKRLSQFFSIQLAANINVKNLGKGISARRQFRVLYTMKT